VLEQLCQQRFHVLLLSQEWRHPEILEREQGCLPVRLIKIRVRMPEPDHIAAHQLINGTDYVHPTRVEIEASRRTIRRTAREPRHTACQFRDHLWRLCFTFA